MRDTNVNSPCDGLHSIMWAWNATVTEARSTDFTRPLGATFGNAAGYYLSDDADVLEPEKYLSYCEKYVDIYKINK